MQVVSTDERKPKSVDAERRSFYRVNDAVALKLHKLDADVVRAARDRIVRREYELLALSGKGAGNAHFQSALRDVESKHPEIANLFRLFEARIDSLVQMIELRDEELVEAPNVVANLSGSGLGIEWPVAFYEGDQLLLELTLFPSLYRMEIVAKVVRGNPKDRSTNGKFHLALEFVEIASSDREALLQHAHQLQIGSLRSRHGTGQ